MLREIIFEHVHVGPDNYRHHRRRRHSPLRSIIWPVEVINLAWTYPSKNIKCFCLSSNLRFLVLSHRWYHLRHKITLPS